jgi:diguanylate cyclase (GGDEF)-like protein
MLPPGPAVDPALHDVIESIVSLTEQRDQRSLEHSLFASLQEMLDQTACWLLSLNDASQELQVVAGNSAQLPETILAILKAGLVDSNLRCVTLPGQSYLLASTLSADDEFIRLLVIARATWDEDNLRLVKGMLRVYQNFVSVLRDSAKDTLTGLYNRHKLEAKLSEMLMSAVRGRRHTDLDHADFLALLDIDHFKRINDNHGHLIGDETLLAFANILRRTLRDDDLIYRYGGEEFIVLLQDITIEQAGLVLERVRRDVERYDFPQVGRVTVSIGYSVMQLDFTPNQVIETADRALYFAKQHGRNRVCQFQNLLVSGAIQAHPDSGSVDLFD